MDKPQKQKMVKLFKQRCRDAGLRLTPQRLGIYKALIHSSLHPTAEQVYRDVRRTMEHVSFDTVNRNLQMFTHIGAAFVVEGSESARRYDGNLAGHQHVKCVKCQKISDLYHEPFEDIAVPAEIDPEFEVLRMAVYIEGLCPECKNKSDNEL